VLWKYDRDAGRADHGPKNEAEMNRPQTSATDELRTVPLRAHEDAANPASVRVVLGRYRLERRLGAGGFGVVWLGWDQKLEREVAVKAIPLERGGGERVEREARAAARLNHPGIVSIYELASDQHEIYLVSELVRGRTLAELTQAGAVSDRDVARIGVELCDALEHAHARGVIHRDVKPQNVMVVADPAAGAGFAKLADFGVAHVASGDPLTRTGDVIGTLAYMAPEQAEGRPVTAASDVYSLALTLYEAWTGSNPVRAGGLAATARRLGRPVPPLAGRRRDLPRDLCGEVDAALDGRPEDRPEPSRLRAALSVAEGEMSDDGGLVEPATLRRVGLPATRRLAPTALGRRPRRSPRAPRPLPMAWPGDQAAEPLRGVLGRRRPVAGGRALSGRLAGRASAGLGAGVAALAAAVWLGPDLPGSPLAIAAVVALAVALLPRIGWLCCAAVLCGWLATPNADVPGSALLVAAAAVAVPLLLPRAGAVWTLPALAPLLGTVALAPAFVGVAALAPTPLRRAGLGAAGGLWLLVAEPLAGRPLLFGSPEGTPGRTEFQGSLGTTAADVLEPLAASPVLLVPVVFVVFAAVLPLVLRGRWLAADLVGAAAWSIGLMAALAAVGDLVGATGASAEARGAVAGSLAGALVAVAISQTNPPPESWRAQAVTTS